MTEAIYCLSRPERQERRDLLTPQLERAFDEGQLPRLPINWWSEPLRQEVFLPGSFSANPGYYAASLAHRLMLEDAWKENHAEILVLEDDAVFKELFYSDFPSFMAEIRANHPDWLALWLGGVIRKEPTKLSPKVILNNGSTQSHAYVINRHGIWRFLDHLWVRNMMVVDWATNELMGLDACVYSPPEWFVGTAVCMSDNYHQMQTEL